jgi:hypothetical protein|tara:strand:+ start:281 stop:535 length:255 start_codon:yes stop_codon:yes gene_type:complete
MWINELTDRATKEYAVRLEKNCLGEIGELLEALYEEVKRLNLMINNNETPYSTERTVDEETRNQLCESTDCPLCGLNIKRRMKQ